ncbi:hypothetical protein LC085_18920 [Bacillus tianshenii]|uniref:hypothetical protein n=1 Tax=Sutcliffiella tianshenii TaxID=1463404 RepID=UPI001CD294E6|nr:hypothetical protein [Bacillus tianshenii]MCA1321971.1 hypothetical protein [Bacillus tianshenii]
MRKSNQAVIQSTYSLKQYAEIIKIMIDFHSLHTGRWLAQQTGVPHYNLKKTMVCDIISKAEEGSFAINNRFFQYIINYKSTLIHLYADIISEVSKNYNCNVKGRVKNEDSILNKLQKKQTEQNGKFSINKVLNDLIGFRIIDTDYEQNVKKLILYLDELKQKEGYRITHKERINGEYRGYHIYFMGKDSKFFPLELQLWDSTKEKTNLISHELYKKDYTNWPEIYYNG